MAIERYRQVFDAVVAPLGVEPRQLVGLRNLVEFFAGGYVLAILAVERVRCGLPGTGGGAGRRSHPVHSYHLVVEGRVGSYARRTQLYRKGADGELRPVRRPGPGPAPEPAIRHRERRFGNSSVHLHIDRPSTERPRLIW